jgi:hypothetical protein
VGAEFLEHTGQQQHVRRLLVAAIRHPAPGS